MYFVYIINLVLRYFFRHFGGKSISARNLNLVFTNDAFLF
jgi:hypothetical protein